MYLKCRLWLLGNYFYFPVLLTYERTFLSGNEDDIALCRRHYKLRSVKIKHYNIAKMNGAECVYVYAFLSFPLCPLHPNRLCSHDFAAMCFSCFRDRSVVFRYTVVFRLSATYSETNEVHKLFLSFYHHS